MQHVTLLCPAPLATNYQMSRKSEEIRRNWLRWAIVKAARLYDWFHRLLARITGRLGKPMAPEIYHAVSHDKSVAVKGRVLLSRKWREPKVSDTKMVNLLQMFRRWATPERPFSLVRISAGGDPVEIRADREGYFEVELPLDQVQADRILVEMPESKVSQPARHGITRPGDNSRHLIISDIDDTVLVTHTVKTLRMIATTVFGNAHTRQLFPGTVQLYQALKRGPSTDGNENNPFAYVTSSPFKLHGLLQLIFKESELPEGAYFMTDWGIDYDRWFKKSHRVHKWESIHQTLNWYPDKTAILIGDSGQHDTEIYIDIALDNPGRIEQILIHDITGPDHIDLLKTQVEKLHGSGTGIDFFSDTREAAEILHKRGWITEVQRQNVAGAVEEPKEEDEKSLLQKVSDSQTDRHPL